MIPFNKPFIIGNELQYIQDSVISGKISGNGTFTNKCQNYFETHFGFKKTLLTTSCTDALEMTAILMNIQPGDEVIVPSYTFVSSALAYIRQGAKIVFADSRADHPGIDEYKIEQLITPKTKAIVIVHYAGVSCDMDVIMDIANRYGLLVVEDAAQAIDSYYKGKPLGSIGHFGTFSFHETKNIISGEGGLLTINDEQFIDRSQIIWEKGTNRSAFFKGEVDKYGWVDTGSSFLPSELTAAYLFGQLEYMEQVQNKRKLLWNRYYSCLKHLEEENLLQLAYIPEYATNNAHMFYVLAKNVKERDELIKHLKTNGVHAVFHYLSLHRSQFYKEYHIGSLPNLVNSDRYTDCLIRLPLFYDLNEKQVDEVHNILLDFFK